MKATLDSAVLGALHVALQEEFEEWLREQEDIPNPYRIEQSEGGILVTWYKHSQDWEPQYRSVEVVELLRRLLNEST